MSLSLFALIYIFTRKYPPIGQNFIPSLPSHSSLFFIYIFISIFTLFLMTLHHTMNPSSLSHFLISTPYSSYLHPLSSSPSPPLSTKPKARFLDNQ